MLHNNKNSKEQCTARNVRLKQKIEVIHQHSQQFNQLYFQFPQPQTNNNPNKFLMTPTKVQHHKTNIADSQDPRRNTIKEKIKFRIKQELWNMLKKSNEKDEHHQQLCQSPPSYDQKQNDKHSSFVCVKGRSFTRFDRDSHHFKKNWSMVSPKRRQQYNRPNTQRQITSVEKNRSGRRLWSSLKMKSVIDKPSAYKQSIYKNLKCCRSSLGNWQRINRTTQLIDNNFSYQQNTVKSLSRLLLIGFDVFQFLNNYCVEAEVTEGTPENVPSCMIQTQACYEKVASYHQQTCGYHYIVDFNTDHSSLPIIETDYKTNENRTDERYSSIGEIPWIFFLYNNSRKNSSQLKYQRISLNSPAQMQDNNFKRRDGEDIIDSLPLQFAEEQFGLVYFACVKHERCKQGHGEEHGFEMGGLCFETVQDDGK